MEVAFNSADLVKRCPSNEGKRAGAGAELRGSPFEAFFFSNYCDKGTYVIIVIKAHYRCLFFFSFLLLNSINLKCECV